MKLYRKPVEWMRLSTKCILDHSCTKSTTPAVTMSGKFLGLKKKKCYLLLVLLKFEMKIKVLACFGKQNHNSFVVKSSFYIWTFKLKFHFSHNILKRCLFPSNHISYDIHTNVLLYDKSGVLKHIKAPTIVEVELTDL